MRSKSRRKIRVYGVGLSEEIMMDAKVFLFLRGSCLKANLQEELKLSSVCDAEAILTDLEGTGYVKRIQDPDKDKWKHDIFSIIRVDGDLLAFVKGIFRYWLVNIHGKKRIQHKLHSHEKSLLERKKWPWGEEFIKRWANYVQKSNLCADLLVDTKKIVEEDRIYDVQTVMKVYTDAESSVKESR